MAKYLVTQLFVLALIPVNGDGKSTEEAIAVSGGIDSDQPDSLVPMIEQAVVPGESGEQRNGRMSHVEAPEIELLLSELAEEPEAFLHQRKPKVCFLHFGAIKNELLLFGLIDVVDEGYALANTCNALLGFIGIFVCDAYGCEYPGN